MLVNTNFKIPVSKPWLSEKSLSYAHDAINSTWLSSRGPYIEKAETLLKEKLFAKQTNLLLVNNGTSAVHLMALALKKFHPDITTIIVPNNVYVAAWNPFIHEGYKLIPIDADINTWNMDEGKLYEQLDKLYYAHTAVLLVHNIGNNCRFSKLREQYSDFLVLEDACEALGTTENNKPVGTLSFAASFSFFGNKNITSGEGGCVITKDKEVFEYMKLVHGQGQNPDKKFIHIEPGWNFRMTNIQAAILYGQLEEWDQIRKERKRVFEHYKQCLKDVKTCVPQHYTEFSQHSAWMFGVRLKGIKYDLLEKHMASDGIETRPMFYPITSHPYMKFETKPDVAVAKKLNKECAILPTYPALLDEEIEFICKTIKEFIER